MTQRALLMLFLLAGPAWAQPTQPPPAPVLKQPAKVSTEVGKLTTITPLESGTTVRYLDPSGVCTFVTAELLVDKRLGIFTATRPGTPPASSSTSLTGATTP